MHGAGLQDTFVLLHRLHDFDGLVDVVCQRLFAIDILSRTQRGERYDCVPVVGRGDADRVDVFPRNEFAEIVVSLTVAVPVVFIHLLLGVVASGGIHIANRHDACFLVEEIAQQTARLGAHADEPHGEAVAGSGIGPPYPGWNDEGRCGS